MTGAGWYGGKQFSSGKCPQPSFISREIIRPVNYFYYRWVFHIKMTPKSYHGTNPGKSLTFPFSYDLEYKISLGQGQLTSNPKNQGNKSNGS